jgi:hypothetical protein
VVNPSARSGSSHLYRQSATYLLLEAAHRYLELPGRFSPAGMNTRLGWPRGRANQFFLGYSDNVTAAGEIPSLALIDAVAVSYRLSFRIVLDRLLEDAGRNEASEVDQLEAAANTIHRYVRAIRERQAPPG